MVGMGPPGAFFDHSHATVLVDPMGRSAPIGVYGRYASL
jgi:hypothetical protein